jgi:para-nitrobenzyl esterase
MLNVKKNRNRRIKKPFVALIVVLFALSMGCSEDDGSAIADEDESDDAVSEVGNRGEAGDQVGDNSNLTTNRPERDGGLAASGASAPIVHLADGPVKGVIAGITFRYMGIPFAAPPTGDLRWRPPQPVEPWEEVLDASKPNNSCIQFGEGIGDHGETSEDCLYLNVWAPIMKTAFPFPVMVWLHGGANVTGSAVVRSQDGGLSYDGQVLVEASPRPVIVVTANYRLGQLGFLAHAGLTAEQGSSGNYALMDQQAALRWVQDNISAFGGDPENITLFGESAGATDSCLQLMAPESKGLFHRIILESAAQCYPETSRENLQEAEAGGAAFADFMGCSGVDDSDAVDCLRGLTVEELKKSVETEELPGGFIYQEPLPYNFAPIIDGVFLPKRVADIVAADEHAKVPVIVGTNAVEGTLFHHEVIGAIAPADEDEYKETLERRFGEDADAVAEEYPISGYDTPNDALIDVTGDSVFVCPSRDLARALAGQGDSVFEYHFTHDVGFGLIASLELGPTHASEIAFVWGFASVAEDATAADQAVGSTIMEYWTRFAYTGDPNGGDTLEWPRFETDTEPEIVLADPVSTTQGRKSDTCDFWATIE